MKNDYFRYYKPKLLIPLLVILGVVFYLGNNFISTHWGLSLSIIAVVTGLLGLIDYKLWKWKPFSYLFWSIDISGQYEGVIDYVNPVNKKRENKQVILDIYQTGSSIKLVSYFGNNWQKEQSASTSLQTSLVNDGHGNYEIVFTYRNDGNQKLGFAPHYGTNLLTVIGATDEGRILEGVYYTNREPMQTKGTMRVKFKSKHTQL